MLVDSELNGDDKSLTTPHLRRGRNQRPFIENCRQERENFHGKSKKGGER